MENTENAPKSFKIKDIFVGKTENSAIQMARNVIVEATRIGLNLFLLWLSFDIIAGKGEYFVTLFGKETNIILSVCTVIASMLSGIANYIFSTIWVFHKRQKNNNIGRFIVFTIIGACGLGINVLITNLLTDQYGLHYLVSNIIAQAVAFLFNFFMRKYIVYGIMSRKKEQLTTDK